MARAGANKKPAGKRLSHGRPPTFSRHAMSSKTTKTLINKHHLLHKEKARALQCQDGDAVERIDGEIERLGGLETYQLASLQGQSGERGGDSSRVLVWWLREGKTTNRDHAECRNGGSEGVDGDGSGGDERKSKKRRKEGLKLLEVGALTTENACSKSGIFDEVERIDLNSRGEGILEQDFMVRPLPRDDGERFDVISLSLVLNYVPDARERGKMLWRTLAFLKAPEERGGDIVVDMGMRTGAPPQKSGDMRAPKATTIPREQDEKEQDESSYPSLFLVLPAPCISNSRYTDDARLKTIMMALGYIMIRQKITPKLVYYLWKKVVLSHPSSTPKTTYVRNLTITRAEEVTLNKKIEVRSGSKRNNFAILLDSAWLSWSMTR